MTRAWVLLVIAGLLEMGWAIGLKYTKGFTRPLESVLTIAAMALSMYLLARAAMQLPIARAYAVWVGISTLETTVLGIWLFQEPVSALRFFFLLMLVVSIIGLNPHVGWELLAIGSFFGWMWYPKVGSPF